MSREKVSTNVELTSLKAVTKADATDLPDGISRGLYLGTAGTLNIVTAAGDECLITLPIGYFPVAVKQVETGGTATEIWAVY